MLTENYNEKAQYDYYRALIAIRAVNDHDASGALNAARQSLLGSEHFTKLTDAHLQQIVTDEDLTIKSFSALYGDYDYAAKPKFKSRPPTAFVPEKLNDMVARHFAQFEAQFGDIRANPLRLMTWEEYQANKTEDGPQIAAGLA